MELSGSWILPVLYGIGSLWVLMHSARYWQIARLTSALALIATVVAAVAIFVGARFDPVASDAVGLVCAILVATLGWVIINYSARYLEGEPGQVGFVRAMLFTLLCVGLLVVSRHLLIIVLAWSGTSLGLHHLLTFYRHRKAAQIVAHKKFLVSRLAEICLALALGLVYYSTGTLALDGLNAYLAGATSLPVPLHLAAVLFALAAILKMAQLPLHGWLIQVMEAPTPVSALLHAGVVNIGGFVLIRLAELLSLAPAAQALLVIVGSCTAVLAGLVMLTRVSIKVRLAWSTCAQMGFMLMEIGLGLYALALLHLVAHSLYKAHAFLFSGDTVNSVRRHSLFEASASDRSLLLYGAAVVVSAALVGGSLLVWQLFLPAVTVPTIALFILALGLASLMWLEQGLTLRQLTRGIISALALIQFYMIWHVLFGELVADSAGSNAPLIIWVVLVFSAFYACQSWLRRYPEGKFSSAVYPWVYAGFYLDETFTRLTFKIWPVKFSPTQAQTPVNRYSTPKGELP